jgi:hypothetical protein
MRMGRRLALIVAEATALARTWPQQAHLLNIGGEDPARRPLSVKSTPTCQWSAYRVVERLLGLEHDAVTLGGGQTPSTTRSPPV